MREAEAGRLEVQLQPGRLSETVSPIKNVVKGLGEVAHWEGAGFNLLHTATAEPPSAMKQRESGDGLLAR